MIDDGFVADTQVRKELGISAVTSWRWDNDPEMRALGWPLPVRYRNSKNAPKHRGRKQYEQFKQNLLQRALHKAIA
jgi:hypothetical protein